MSAILKFASPPARDDHVGVRWPCTPQTDPDPPLAKLPLAEVYERAVKPPAG